MKTAIAEEKYPDNYKVVLEGYKPGKGEYYIEQDLANLLQITRENVREFLQAAPKMIKENLSLEEATKHKEAIEKTGAACDIENMKYNLGGLSLGEIKIKDDPEELIHLVSHSFRNFALIAFGINFRICQALIHFRSHGF